KIFPRQHPSPAGHQFLKQSVLLTGQIHGHSADPYHPEILGDPYITNPQLVFILAELPLPSYFEDAAEEFVDIEGPGNVIVDAGIDCLDPVLRILLSSQHDDGDGVACGYPNAPAKLDAAHGRGGNIHNDKVRLILVDSAECPVAVDGEDDVVTFQFQR